VGFMIWTVRRCSTLLALIAMAALSLAFPRAIAAQTLENGPIKVTDNGSITPSGYALKGVTGTANNAGLFGYGNVSSSSINIDGVVGYVQTAQSVGVVGWAQSTGTSAYGVYGYSASGPGVYGFNNNGGAASIYGYNTTSVGTAIFGNSTQGTAINGTSGTAYGVYGETDTGTTNFGGVYGKDASSVGGNYGVVGESTLGKGVAAFNVGTYPGTLGATTSDALLAHSMGGNDSIDSYVYGGGYFANYFYDDAGLYDGWFEAAGSGSVALVAISDASKGGEFAAAVADGVGAMAFGKSGNQQFPVLAADEEAPGTYSFAAYNDTPGNSGGGPGVFNETFVISDTHNFSGDGFTNGTDVNISGDVYVTGRVYTQCEVLNLFPERTGADCLNGPYVTRASTGAKIRTYPANQSLPTMEDFGEAQLSNGQAAVSLEKTFASTIDTKRSYLVFITPEGECNVLYVATKTPAGFIVREAKGGHSTIAFQYRIVAHPYGDSSERLAAIAPRRNVARHAPFVRDGDPRSNAMMSAVARSKSMRAAEARSFVQRVHTPQKSALPLVNPALFRQ
jgi:hypothetical protein